MANISIEKNIMVPMRGGVQLVADVDVFDIMRAVRAGYTVVAQDVRRLYASEGTINSHVQETADGIGAVA